VTLVVGRVAAGAAMRVQMGVTHTCALHEVTALLLTAAAPPRRPHARVHARTGEHTDRALLRYVHRQRRPAQP
jgi:hypothetical protein